MRTQTMRRLVSLKGAAILIALIAGSGFAQQPLQETASERNPCDRYSWRSHPWVRFTRTGSQTEKAHVNLSQTISRSRRPQCDFFALAGLPPTSRSRDYSGGFSGSELFEFGAAPAMSGSRSRHASETAKRESAQARSPAEAQELAKKLSNPVASLISFPLQGNFDFGMGTGSGWRYTLNVQPVIPIKLNENWNVISRTIIPVIHQSNVTGPGTSQSGLGDLTQSFFFSPNKSEPFIWAVGPALLLPTATDAQLGTQKFGLGPTALILKQVRGWTYGILANHIWSVAGKSSRSDVSATFLQPFLAYTNRQAWTYTINTESTYDWVSNSWSVPINPLVSKLVRFGKQPMSFGGGIKCWVKNPTGGPENCSIRIVITALFPKE